MTTLTPLYLHSALERRNDLRARTDWLEAVLSHPDPVLLPYWQGKALMDPSQIPAAMAGASTETVGKVLEEAGETVLLGEAEGRLYVAADISHIEDVAEAAALCGGGRFYDLRRHAPEMDGDAAALLAQARGLFIWHQRHRFCGVCGSKTRPRSGGYERVCTNPDCATPQYPRLDPAVIMLVTHEDQCLLARGSRLPEGIVTTLAGFIEPGENLEQAVKREVKEEVGVDVGEPVYLGSQPWPFPTSFMLGFHVEATTTELTLDPDEIEYARWFTRDEVRRLDEFGFTMPRKDSIARLLVEAWVAQG